MKIQRLHILFLTSMHLCIAFKKKYEHLKLLETESFKNVKE